MKNSKILPVSFLALMTVLGGLTVATAQSTTTKMPSASGPEKVKQAGARGHHRDGAFIGTLLKQADTDSDRAVTQAEIDTFRAGLVTSADASGEGDISLDEFQTIYLEMNRNKMVDAFQKLDDDGDGAVTQAEMDARFGDVVERMDRNGDGKLDRNDRSNHDRKKSGDRKG